jgi:hypothetical protein
MNEALHLICTVLYVMTMVRALEPVKVVLNNTAVVESNSGITLFFKS